MIKIFISATDDGFSTKYASDGILEDDVTAKVLDKRSLFSGDILHGEGYAFQPLPSQGILYHKIILLNEVVGRSVRDGYVMFSLFVPINCGLSGTDIKDALDSIVNDYRRAINGYSIKLNIDLSFVAAKAEELNAKAKSSPWSKKPSSNNNTGKVALLPVDDNRVAEYFQYPWPLHKDFSGFSMVFLTQRLLNPARQTPDGINGYKALSTNIIDVSNPEYSIEYENVQRDATLYSNFKRTTISKSELDNSKGDIYLGTYSRRGYRSQRVTIKAGTQSDDGSTIKVQLPTLDQKKATLTLIVVNGKGDSLTNATCTCTNGSDKMSLALRYGCTFNFLGEQCGKDWTISVQCESYNDHTETIEVNDGSQKTITINLTPKPQWNVKAIDSTGTGIISFQSTDKDEAINLAKQSLTKKTGCDDFEVKEDAYNVTVKGKKQETDISQTLPSQDIPSTATATSSTAPSNNNTPEPIEPHITIAPSDNSQENTSSDQAQPQSDSPKKTYILQLDKAYPIFENNECGQQLREKGVEYKENNPRLECSNKDAAKGVLCEDKYHKYYVQDPKWRDEDPYSVPRTNTVKRKLLKKYRVCIGLAIALLLCAIVGLSVHLFGNKDKKAVEELETNTDDFMTRNSKALYGVRYCGNIVYDSMESFHSQWVDLIKKNEEKYKTFTSLDSLYELQTQYKKCDSIILDSGRTLLTAENLDTVKWKELKRSDTMYSHLSEEHKNELDSLVKARSAELKQYDSCTKTQDTNILNAYLQQYDTVKSFPTHVNDVRYIKQRLKVNSKKAQGNSVPQPPSQNAKGNSKVETKTTGGKSKSNSDAAKKSITSLEALFDALDSAYVGQSKFYGTYQIKDVNLRNHATAIIEKVCACIKEGTLTYEKYNKKYNEIASKENPPAKRFDELKTFCESLKNK